MEKERNWRNCRKQKLSFFTTKEADKLRATVPKARTLESRFVRTRRVCPDTPDKSEIKCRWVVKSFRDPSVETLEGQSPTFTADGLACVLQLLASMKWVMHVADIEGTFSQGDEYRRDSRRIYVMFPSDNTIFQLTKFD